MKSDVRKRVLEKRNALTTDERYKKSQIILEQLIPYLHHCRCVGIYKSFSSEVDTEAIISFLLENDKMVCLPKCFTQHRMKFYNIDEHTCFAANHKGILEPIDAIAISPDQMDLMIIPMVAYHKEHRLGYGGGYYDCYLQHCDAYKIGIAFTCQEADFEIANNDIAMDIVIHG